jgi:toxin HigB-1
MRSMLPSYAACSRRCTRRKAPDNMNAPGHRLHQLKGGRKRQWAVWVSANWRLVFEFEGDHATNVDLVDYH